MDATDCMPTHNCVLTVPVWVGSSHKVSVYCQCTYDNLSNRNSESYYHMVYTSNILYVQVVFAQETVLVWLIYIFIYIYVMISAMMYMTNRYRMMDITNIKNDGVYPHLSLIPTFSSPPNSPDSSTPSTPKNDFLSIAFVDCNYNPTQN